MKLDDIIAEDVSTAPEGLPKELAAKWDSLPYKRKLIIKRNLMDKRMDDLIARSNAAIERSDQILRTEKGKTRG